jgi:hypothetical protein
MYSAQVKNIYAELYEAAIEKLACSYGVKLPAKNHGQKKPKRSAG